MAMRKVIYFLFLVSFLAFAGLSFKAVPDGPDGSPGPDRPTIAKDSIGSVTAFMSVYKVLMSPRCMNCHPSGDAPLQGDDSHIHTMNVKRGVDGKGLYSER